MTYPMMSGIRPCMLIVTSEFSCELDREPVMTGALSERTSTVITVAKMPSVSASTLPLLSPGTVVVGFELNLDFRGAGAPGG
jgi:hypothetical protein